MVRTRKSTVFFIYLVANLALVLSLFVHSIVDRRQESAALSGKTEMVKGLGLTDLCLFTEARYTRHLSMADLNTPFQDHPMSLEHFPSGSLVGLPEHLQHKGPASAEKAGR